MRNPDRYEKKTLLDQFVHERMPLIRIATVELYDSRTLALLFGENPQTIEHRGIKAPLPLKWTTEWSHQQSTVGKATRLNRVVYHHHQRGDQICPNESEELTETKVITLRIPMIGPTSTLVE